MKYAPGSFSKNFAWGNSGFLKLHTAIRNGFNEKLQPVGRNDFRRDCKLGNNLSLIPVNFFLHNNANTISVDELVYQAIAHQYSKNFGYLALFAFHLNRAGINAQANIEPRPAMWANKFVRGCLWSGGCWNSKYLDTDILDAAMADSIDAEQNVVTKCRANYRYLFEINGYIQSQQLINTHFENWISSAIFLSWDRHILNGGEKNKKTLIELIHTDEIYKLLGTTEDYAHSFSEKICDSYLDVGDLGRLNKIGLDGEPQPNIDPRQNDWLSQEGIDCAVERRRIEIFAQNRNRKDVAKLKSLYDNHCLFCDIQLKISAERYYSEAAHIKPLGKPHDGPDKIENMLVLCPNHHLQFDNGVLTLKLDDNSYKIISTINNDSLNGKKISLLHKLDEECVNYHRNWFNNK